MTSTNTGQRPDSAYPAELKHQAWLLMSAYGHWERASDLLKSGDVDGAGDMLGEVGVRLDAIEMDHLEAVRVLLRLKAIQAEGAVGDRERGWLENKMEHLFGIDVRGTFQFLNAGAEFSDQSL